MIIKESEETNSLISLNNWLINFLPIHPTSTKVNKKLTIVLVTGENTVGTHRMNTRCKSRNKSTYRKYTLCHRKSYIVGERKNISNKKEHLPLTARTTNWMTYIWNYKSIKILATMYQKKFERNSWGVGSKKGKLMSLVITLHLLLFC